MSENANSKLKLNPLRIIFSQEEFPKCDLFQMQVQIGMSDNEHCIQLLKECQKACINQLQLCSQFINHNNIK